MASMDRLIGIIWQNIKSVLILKSNHMKQLLHLLTDDPRAVRRLGDADVRLHLLARVDIAGHAGWYCTELN